MPPPTTTPPAPIRHDFPPANPLSVSAFQKLIYERYYPSDSARGVPGTFLWFMEELGELATALQNNAPGKSPTAEERANLGEEFADVIAWLTTMANIHHVDLADALRKYTEPGRVQGVKD
jgi:NTP pyrophosphatase (non-canonical NTP hydrolase)